MRRLSLALAAGLLVALAGCDSGAGEVDPRPVVSASLIVGEGLPTVRIARAQPLLDPYDESQTGIAGATVAIDLLGPDGRTVETTFAYGPSQAEGALVGDYAPLDNGATALGGRVYRLRASVPAASGTGVDEVSAETATPPAFEIVEGVPAEVVYQEGNGPQIRLTRSSTPARQAVYVLSANATARDQYDEIEVDGETRYRRRFDPGTFGPVPFVYQIADCEQDGADEICERNPRDFGGGRSPLLNESSFEDAGDGTVRLTIPFLAFNFFGPQDLTLYSLDDALQDFIETQQIQAAPTTISPGEIPNATTNIRGGLGVFGSVARATTSTILREE